MGECQFTAGGTVWRRGGDNVGGVASAVGRGRGARWNEDGGGRARHSWAVVWNIVGKGGGQVVDTKRTVGWKSWCKGIQCEERMRIF